MPPRRHRGRFIPTSMSAEQIRQADLLAQVTLSVQAWHEADEKRRAAIVAAVDAGIPVRRIAEHANMTHPRVVQIVKEARS